MKHLVLFLAFMFSTSLSAGDSGEITVSIVKEGKSWQVEVSKINHGGGWVATVLSCINHGVRESRTIPAGKGEFKMRFIPGHTFIEVSAN